MMFPFFFKQLSQNERVLIIFGTQNIVNLSTWPVKCIDIMPCEIRKSNWEIIFGDHALKKFTGKNDSEQPNTSVELEILSFATQL